MVSMVDYPYPTEIASISDGNSTEENRQKKGPVGRANEGKANRLDKSAPKHERYTAVPIDEEAADCRRQHKVYDVTSIEDQCEAMGDVEGDDSGRSGLHSYHTE